MLEVNLEMTTSQVTILVRVNMEAFRILEIYQIITISIHLLYRPKLLKQQEVEDSKYLQDKASQIPLAEREPLQNAIQLTYLLLQKNLRITDYS